MFYKELEINGTNYKLAVNLYGSNAPTTATEGTVGQIYMDTDTGRLYKCTAVDGTTYTWAVEPVDLTVVQTLTDAQKAQVRENVGAASADEITDIVTDKQYTVRSILNAADILSITGHFINAYTGEAGVSANHNCSDYIKVVAGDVINYDLAGSDHSAGLIYSYYTNKSTYLCVAAGAGVGVSVSGTYTVVKDGYIRFCNRVDYSGTITINGGVPHGITDLIPDVSDVVRNNYKESEELFEDEYQSVFDEVLTKITSKALVFAVISDTHYQNYNLEYYPEAIHNMKIMNDKLSFDGIIHLGDVIDGGNDTTNQYKFLNDAVKYMLDIKARNLFIVTGNHDNNGLGTVHFTDSQMYSSMHRHNETQVVRSGITSNYYVDYPNFNIRIIFVDSCYQAQGFSDDTVTWLTSVLSGAPSGYKFVLFSHEPTRGSLIRTTSSESVNSDDVETPLAGYGDRVLGWLHGHTHFDNVSYVNTYPEISINCNYTYNPTGANYPTGATVPSSRALGTINQDCWDIVAILPTENKFELIRFGAGESRTIPFRQIVN